MLISKCNFVYGLKVARCLQWHIKGVLDTSVRVSHWCRDNGGRLFKICWEGESLHQYMWKTWELQRSDSLEGFQWSFNWKLIKAQWLTSVSEIVLLIMTQSWSWGSQISDKKMKQILTAVFEIWIFSRNHFTEEASFLMEEVFIFRWRCPKKGICLVKEGGGGGFKKSNGVPHSPPNSPLGETQDICLGSQTKSPN